MILNKFTIRQLNNNDVHAYRDIRLEMLKDKPEAFGDSYENTKKEESDFFLNLINRGKVFSVFEKDEIIATTGCFIQQGEHIQHKAYIWGVYVKPQYRGKNISYDLLQSALKDLPSEIDLVQLVVTRDNVAAEKTYKKAGFEVWGVQEKAVKVKGVFYDNIHMVKFMGS